MPSNPTRLYISRKLKKLVDDARKYDNFFKELENKNFFFLALRVGYSNKSRLPLGNKEEFVRAEYLNDIDAALLKAIAVADTKDIKVINDITRVYEIAEEYANGATEHLRALIFEDPASFTKKLVTLFREKRKHS